MYIKTTSIAATIKNICKESYTKRYSKKPTGKM